MKKDLFYETLRICENCIRRSINDSIVRLDFNSKLYAEGIRFDLSLMEKYLSRNSSILDLGCGKGHISVLLSTLGYSVKGIDIETSIGEQLEIHKKKWQEKIWKELESKFNVEYHFYDGWKIPYGNHTVDAVNAYALIEHISGDVLEFLVREISRILRPNGYLFIFRCPRKWAISEYIARLFKMSHHERLLNEEDIKQLLKKNNFEILKLERTDLIPAFPSKNLQEFWNFCYPLLHFFEKTLLRTQINKFSHHMRIVVRKQNEKEIR